MLHVMHIRLSEPVAQNLRMLAATTQPYISVPKLVNALLAEAVAARAAARPPKRDAVPVRRSLK